jgi:ferredoxin
LKRLSDFKLPPLSGEAILGNEAAQERLHSRTILRPQVNPELCTGCGTCVATCPCNAITQFGFTDDEVRSEVLALLGKQPAAVAA